MIEEKIAKFRELIAKRDEIDREIGLFLGAGIETGQPTPKPMHPPTLPQQAPKKPKPAAVPRLRGQRVEREPCAECGSKATRRNKQCSQSAANKAAASVSYTSNGRTILDKAEKISEADWTEIKSQYDDGVLIDMVKLSYPQYDRWS